MGYRTRSKNPALSNNEFRIGKSLLFLFLDSWNWSQPLIRLHSIFFLSMESPQLIVFDLAGTTVYDDQDVPRILKMSLEKFRVIITIEDASRVMGIPKPVAIRQLLNQYNYPDPPEGLIHQIHEEFMSTMIRFYKEDSRVMEMPGAGRVFSQIRDRGTRVFVDTGFDRTITDALLDRLGWVRNNLIDGSVTSEEVDRGRPFADMIFKAMEMAGVTDVKRVAKVGDTASDLQEGTAAGCSWVIGVTTGAYSVTDLAREPHTHLAGSLDEVFAILFPN